LKTNDDCRLPRSILMIGSNQAQCLRIFTACPKTSKREKDELRCRAHSRYECTEERRVCSEKNKQVKKTCQKRKTGYVVEYTTVTNASRNEKEKSSCRVECPLPLLLPDTLWRAIGSTQAVDSGLEENRGYPASVTD